METKGMEQYVAEMVSKLPDLTSDQINRFSSLMAGVQK